jgi:Xaa-Pro aminopeptidase
MSDTSSAPYYQTDFPAEEFNTRRDRVLEQIGSESVAVLQGASLTGGFDLFRQTNELYYLCGVEVPHTYLTIDGRNGKSCLYLPPRDPKNEKSEGASLSADDVDLLRSLTGVDNVSPLADLAGDLSDAPAIYTPHSPAETLQMCQDMLRHRNGAITGDPNHRQSSREEDFIALLNSYAPGAEIRDLSPMLNDLRVIKSPLEVGMMRRAGRLTALAVTEAMRSTRPGLMEYHLGAVADYVYRAGGAWGGGYRPIVACGKNIWNAHYYRNNCGLVDGELVIMDYAPDVGCYTSDIGRIWPVGGKYSSLQRELYGFIVEYHKVLLDTIRPGEMASAIMLEAAAKMKPIVETWEFSKPIYRDAARRTLDFQGHLSHGVGMAVHDVGDYTSEVLRPGVVFALDPQMWIPEEQLYIRVEDTVAVTKDGVENLTQLAPLELDDVERVMTEEGMLQSFPPDVE